MRPSASAEYREWKPYSLWHSESDALKQGAPFTPDRQQQSLRRISSSRSPVQVCPPPPDQKMEGLKIPLSIRIPSSENGAHRGATPTSQWSTTKKKRRGNQSARFLALNSACKTNNTPQDLETQTTRLATLRAEFEASRTFEDDDLFFRAPDQTTRHDIELSMQAERDEAKKQGYEAQMWPITVYSTYPSDFGQITYSSPASVSQVSTEMYGSGSGRNHHSQSYGQSAQEFTGSPKPQSQGHKSSISTSTVRSVSSGSLLDAEAKVFEPAEE